MKKTIFKNRATTCQTKHEKKMIPQEIEQEMKKYEKEIDKLFFITLFTNISSRAFFLYIQFKTGN